MWSKNHTDNIIVTCKTKGQKKIICVFQVAQPYQGFCFDPKYFIVNFEENIVNYAEKWGEMLWKMQYLYIKFWTNPEGAVWSGSLTLFTIALHHLDILHDMVKPRCSNSKIIQANMSCSWTKLTKWSVCPVKTQISLVIRAVWSEASLFAWRNIGSLASHWAQREDWSGCVDVQADLNFCLAHRSLCWLNHAPTHITCVP